MSTPEDYNRQEYEAGRLTWEQITELVRVYQATRRITVDGLAGPETQRSLASRLAASRSDLAKLPGRCYPLPSLGRDLRPQITSLGRWNNPDRPTHNGVDLFYAWRAGVDPVVPVGDGGATRAPDGKPRWWIPPGTHAIASANGIVEMAGDTGTGHRVWIRHVTDMTNEPTEWRTGYFHLRSLMVRPGDHVSLGAKLGEVGDNPSDVDAKHLHFEFYAGQLTGYPHGSRDPLEWLAGAGYFIP